MHRHRVQRTSGGGGGQGAIPVPPSDLSQHLGELLHCQAAVDVIFSVSGECFAAHKSVLAAGAPLSWLSSLVK
jgi:speckle-type POZ protein